MKHIYKVSLIIFAISVLSWCFYWFEYRVYLIERDCSDKLLASAVSNENRDLYDKNIKLCINSGGYEKFRKILSENRPIELDEEVTENAQIQIEVR